MLKYHDALCAAFQLVGALREPIGAYCADLSTSVKFDTEVDQRILISFFEGAKVGAHWGRHISQIQDGHHSLFYFS